MENPLKLPAKKKKIIFNKVTGCSMQICLKLNLFRGINLGKYEL